MLALPFVNPQERSQEAATFENRPRGTGSEHPRVLGDVEVPPQQHPVPAADILASRGRPALHFNRQKIRQLVCGRLGTAIALASGMEIRTQLLGHPVHQMLVVFPLGALGLSVASDALHAWRHERRFQDTAKLACTRGGAEDGQAHSPRASRHGAREPAPGTNPGTSGVLQPA